MSNDLFSHGIGRADVIAGTVRLELYTLVPSEAGTDPRPVVDTVVHMPLEGFVRSMSVLEGIVQQMIKAGVVSRREGGAETAPLPNLP